MVEVKSKWIRCGGRVVYEWLVVDGEAPLLVSKCLNCGDVVDDIILENRSHYEKDA